LNGQTEGVSSPPASGRWLFSAPVDLAVFLGSAVLSLVALAVGAQLGLLHGDTPDWAWVPCVLLIDVAHVWATCFRVYFDPAEMKRRPLLYTLVPIGGFVIGVALYSEGELLFWRVLAYLAVFHFVRQQYGWVALYRARAGETDRLGKWIDTAAIYLATLYPLLYWHTHLPRRFKWFMPYDFAELPPLLERLVEPVYWSVLALYAARSAYCWLRGEKPNPGKDLVVATTAVCWYVGIVAFNSDYAFTVTNVIIHGVPYFVLVFWYWHMRRPGRDETPGGLLRAVVTFLATVWVLAYVEELLWDRSIWQEREWLFGTPWELGSFQAWLVPLLALPQITHYLLDGFIWRRRKNPGFTLVNQPPRPVAEVVRLRVPSHPGL
jgi:hypothetical protein